MGGGRFALTHGDHGFQSSRTWRRGGAWESAEAHALVSLSSWSLATWESSVGTWGDEGLPLLVLLGAQDSWQGDKPDLPLWEYLHSLGSYTGLFHSGTGVVGGRVSSTRLGSSQWAFPQIYFPLSPQMHHVLFKRERVHPAQLR